MLQRSDRFTYTCDCEECNVHPNMRMRVQRSLTVRLPSAMCEETWIRHGYSIDDVARVVRSAHLIDLWNLGLLERLNVVNQAMKPSYAEHNTIIFGAGTHIKDALIKHFRSKLPQLTKEMSVLCSDDALFEPPVPIHVIPATQYATLLRLWNKFQNPPAAGAHAHHAANECATHCSTHCPSYYPDSAEDDDDNSADKVHSATFSWRDLTVIPTQLDTASQRIVVTRVEKADDKSSGRFRETKTNTQTKRPAKQRRGPKPMPLIVTDAYAEDDFVMINSERYKLILERFYLTKHVPRPSNASKNAAAGAQRAKGNSAKGNSAKGNSAKGNSKASKGNSNAAKGQLSKKESKANSNNQSKAKAKSQSKTTTFTKQPKSSTKAKPSKKRKRNAAPVQRRQTRRKTKR